MNRRELLALARDLNEVFSIDLDCGDIRASLGSATKINGKRTYVQYQEPVAPDGYCWRRSGPKDPARCHWNLERYTTAAEVEARMQRLREPWREYTDVPPPWRMPPKNGYPTKLARLLAECGDVDGN